MITKIQNVQTGHQTNELLTLISRLPDNLTADWRDTNHYELTTSGDEHFWADFAQLFQHIKDENWCETEQGQRVGLVLDVAASAKENEQALIAQDRTIKDLLRAVRLMTDALDQSNSTEAEPELRQAISQGKEILRRHEADF